MWYNVYWINKFGGDNTRIIINGYLKNITESEYTPINVNGIKTKNKISYIFNEERFILRLLSNKKIILERETNQTKNAIYFEHSKRIPSVYTLKENDLDINIDITTKFIEITTNSIKIIYLVNESNNEYEYFIKYSLK